MYKSFIVLLLVLLSLLNANDLSDLQQSKSPESKPETDSNLSFFYKARFDFMLDNLEDSQKFWDTRTIYAISITPEIGIKYTLHSLNLGAYLAQNMGETKVLTLGKMIAYYEYDGEYFGVNAGIFPRKNWNLTYPLSYFRNDFLFYNALSNGIKLSFKTKPESKLNTKAELIFDWYGGNLDKRIDEFFVLGGIKASAFRDVAYGGASFLMFHTKNSDILGKDGAIFTGAGGVREADTYLMDRIYYDAHIGADFTPLINIFSLLKIQGGILGSIERKRRLSGLGDFSNAAGFSGLAAIEFKGFGVEELIYYGNGQMKYFNEYGETFYEGLPFYRSDYFFRSNAYYRYSRKNFNTKLSLMFYALPNGTLSTQQRLDLTFKFNSKI